MKKFKLFILILLLIPLPSFGAISDWTEDFEGPCTPNTCGCGTGCGRTNETFYTFASNSFRCIEGGGYWTNSTHQASGGINNSGYFRAVVPASGCTDLGDDNSAYLMVRPLSSGDQTTWNDASFYVRIAMRFSSGWSSGGFPELKLWYHYPMPSGVSKATMFWAADYTGEDLLRLYLTDQNYYVTHNSHNTNASHEYKFRISQHYGKWFVFSYWHDWSTTTSKYKLWITTEDGATNCSAGTRCLVGGINEYNNFLYIDTELTGGTAVNTQRMDFGFFLNTGDAVAGSSTVDFDSFAVSENQLTSNIFTIPSSVQGLTIQGGSLR